MGRVAGEEREGKKWCNYKKIIINQKKEKENATFLITL